jgi:hypothetical protein
MGVAKLIVNVVHETFHALLSLLRLTYMFPQLESELSGTATLASTQACR